MSETTNAGRRQRLVRALPRVPISSPEELPGLLEAHRPLIARYVEAYGPPDAPDDFLQDGLVYMLSDFDRVCHHPLAALAAWMRQSAATPGPAEVSDVEGSTPFRDDVAADKSAVLRSVLQEASDRDRQIISLRLSGLPDAAIAARVGATKGNVRVVVHRLRQKVKERWLEACGGGIGFLGLPRLPRVWTRITQSIHGRMARALDSSMMPASSTGTMLLALAGVTMAAAQGIPAHTGSAVTAVNGVPPGHSAPVAAAAWYGDETALHQLQTVKAPAASHANSVGGASTPQDVHLLSAVASPEYRHDHTIVAAGTDPACRCWRLFLTDDAGRSWDEAGAPSTGVRQLFLPASFPADPVIFCLDQQQRMWRAPRFGAEFVPVDAPGGASALSARFAEGDHDAFIVTTEGLWRVDVDTGAGGVAVAAPSQNGEGSVVTGAGSGMDVIAWLAGPSLGTGSSPAAMRSTSLSIQPGLYGCLSAQCHLWAPAPLDGVGLLVASPEAANDHRIAAMTSDAVAVSSDEGRSFRRIALPDGVRLALSVAVLGQDVWLEVETQTGEVRVLHQANDSGVWTDVTTPAIAVAGTLSVLPDGTVMDLLGDHGFRCLPKGTGQWRQYCGE